MDDQLHQMPSKIFILSLMLNPKAHREALIKVLNKAHVTQDIIMDQFDEIVTIIIANNNLGFRNEEFPSKGRAHNNALNVSMKSLNNVLTRVLVDIGSSLNVMPKSSLVKLLIDGAYIKPSAIVVKVFDGLRRAVIGEVDLPIQSDFTPLKSLYS